MQEAIQEPTNYPSADDPLVAAAARAEAWAGEPFLRDGEESARVLAEGTARRRAPGDGRRREGSVLEVEGALRADARPRADPRRAGAAYGRGHCAAPPSDRRARRDAHRAHRREPEVRRSSERERQWTCRHG